MPGDIWHKLRKVDFAGAISSLAANILILVPLSLGGSIYPWSSTLIIALLVCGIASVAAFLIIEWRFAVLPVLPCKLHWASHGLPLMRRLALSASLDIQDNCPHIRLGVAQRLCL